MPSCGLLLLCTLESNYKLNNEKPQSIDRKETLHFRVSSAISIVYIFKSISCFHNYKISMSWVVTYAYILFETSFVLISDTIDITWLVYSFQYFQIIIRNINKFRQKLLICHNHIDEYL